MYKPREWSHYSNLDINVQMQQYKSFWLKAADYINENKYSISYRSIKLAFIIYEEFLDVDLSVVECLEIAKKNINVLDNLIEEINIEQINNHELIK